MKCERCATHCDGCDERLSDVEIGCINAQVVQIIPAPGWRAVYGNDRPESYRSLVAWGVTRSGGVVPLSAIDEGVVQDARDASNFLRIKHAEDVK